MRSQSASYHGYRFPPDIISHAVWLYYRFCLSFRDAEDLLAQRGVTVTYETIRQWCQRLGPVYARQLRRRRGRMGDTWHLDEVFVTIQGRQQYLWRAVDEDGDVLDILVQSHRNRRAAVRFFRKLLKTQGRIPRRLITDQLRSYAATCRTVMPSVVHVTDQYANSRAEASHQPTRQRERQMRRFTSAAHVQRFASVHGVGTRSCAESLSSRATSTPVEPPPRVPKAGVRRMGCGDVCVLNERGQTTWRRNSALSTPS